MIAGKLPHERKTEQDLQGGRLSVRDAGSAICWTRQVPLFAVFWFLFLDAFVFRSDVLGMFE